MTQDNPTDDFEVVTLPFYVKAAGGMVALQGLVALTVTAQLLLLGRGDQAVILVLIATCAVGGLGAIATGGGLYKGRTWGAVGGIATVITGGVGAVAPAALGVYALTSFFAAALGLVAVILAAISIPACIRFTRYQRDLLDI